MSQPIQWNYGDLASHAGTIGNTAASLSDVHNRIMADVQACGEFWQSKGQAAYDQFVTELNRNFQVAFESLEDHGRRVTQTTANTQDHDSSVASSWA
jgi:WXG100 family type VII secretion target